MASDAYDWHFTQDVEEFLDQAEAFLWSEPALHTVQLTVTEMVRTNGTTGCGEDAPYFGLLVGGDGTVHATVMRTPPFQLQLTALPDGAADALAVRLVKDGRAVPSIFGPTEATAEFAAAWERRTGATARLAMSQRLHRLGALTPPEPAPPGCARAAGTDDRKLIARWYDQFCTDIGEAARHDPEHWAESRLAQGGVVLWETPDGTPVSMASAPPEVAGQVRVTTVYTPAPLRGRGYAGGATAAVSRNALDSGAKEVLLFTDLANPTSNGLYQRLGYRPVTDFATYEFGDGTTKG
ncbi:GNAT family N-acetyltransferase [Streptomyces chiangmaiensis]|uniref:GNAT family N-acetyltransferase n=1 Tax=Streptomyces chiangmaiensis TaxID=766497 RepID=A0ABU7FT65_9ACTN|nr:GNAT family N-acetyltransferase [Streptomyces chiangmaiensis]MED7827002.1 GNAT family N-acetyltransferase [Streptomyces chiangmaiensis]